MKAKVIGPFGAAAQKSRATGIADMTTNCPSATGCLSVGLSACLPVSLIRRAFNSYLNFRTFIDECHPMDTLKSSLIDLHHFEIRPNESTKQAIYLNTDSSYIGLTAAYRNIDTAEWKKIIPVNSREKVTLAVELESDNLQAHIEK